MAYVPLIKVVPQFFDNLGNPLVGGTLNAYVAGTTTPTNLFSNNTGTVAGTSITLDSRGEPTTIKSVWLDTAVTYKLVLKDSTGATIWTFDNINASDLVDGSVTAAKLATDSVTTAKIVNLNVTSTKIADAAVTTAKIADSNVTTSKIADSNVTTAKIADANVTTVKILDANVTTAKIANSNVTTAKIADANVTPAKLSEPYDQLSNTPTTLSGTSVTIGAGFISSYMTSFKLQFHSVGTNGTSPLLITLNFNSSGTISTTYNSGSQSGTSTATSTSGIVLYWSSATDYYSGTVEISRISYSGFTANHIYVSSHCLGSTVKNIYGGGVVDMTSTDGTTLASITISTVGGVNTFDSGTVNLIAQ